MGLITTIMNDCNTWPVSRDKLIIFRIVLLTKGKTSLSSLFGQGSNRHVIGLNEEIIEDSCLRSTEEKRSRCVSGLNRIPNALVFEVDVS